MTFTKPSSSGSTIPRSMYLSITKQANAYASTRPWYPEFQLQLRFERQFCYLDAVKKDEAPFHLGRLRYVVRGVWSLALYTYSEERYEPCMLPGGVWIGSLEDVIAVCELYLV